jgi:hypothetical protein
MNVLVEVGVGGGYSNSRSWFLSLTAGIYHPAGYKVPMNKCLDNPAITLLHLARLDLPPVPLTGLVFGVHSE